MTAPKQLTIILPSFGDPRIVETIASIRAMDDADTARVLVIDGGSPSDLIALVRGSLTDNDVLVSERDKGIFDALNKGLAMVETPYLGWIGADDLFTGEVRTSEIVAALEDADLFVTSLAFFAGDKVRRVTHSWPSAIGLSKLGLHNPHYATFGRSSLLTSERFDIDDIASDIDYFLRIFGKQPRIVRTAAIGTLQGEGGFSNGSWRKLMKINSSAYKSYCRHSNPVMAAGAIAAKVGYKALGRLYFSVRPVDWPSRYPVAREAQTAARAHRPPPATA